VQAAPLTASGVGRPPGPAVTAHPALAAPDEALHAALQGREARVEHRVNLVRGAAIAPLMIADLVYGWLAGILTPPLLRDWTTVLAVFLLYFGLVHRLTRAPAYRPWLKYVTVTVDYVLTVVLFVECRRVDFLVRAAPVDGVAVFVGFLVLLNVLGAFRHGGRIILYGTALSAAAALYLAMAYTESIALMVYSPVLLVSCGLLTFALSSGLTDLFLLTQRRQWLTRFLPRPVAEGIEAGVIPLDLSGVKCEATILLADLRRFTALAESRDPAEVVAVLNEHFATMAAVIWQHGGMIDKFIGDAILAVFGVPVARPDDAVRAATTAICMQEALRGLNEGRARRGGPRLEMGIALHTGTVLAGPVGTPQRLEYTIVGDAVNVAARIEELNKQYRTAILMSEATSLRVRDRIVVRSVAEVTLRGRHDAVRLFTPVPPGG
jgi:adenylate cyclase